jgi:multidrug resistance efflux pump
MKSPSMKGQALTDLHTRIRRGLQIALLTAVILPACTREDPSATAKPYDAKVSEEAKPAITNRVDIPASVRQNLGMTFAKVEPRPVASTLRLPGAFELPPTAMREYRAPLAGRVELKVSESGVVNVGDTLYELDAPDWRTLAEEIAATEAKVASMGPLREAHRVHEASLGRKVELWKARLVQLEEIRAAGGGNAREMNEAQATLVATEAELADVMEKDAALDAEQKMAEAMLRGLRARREAIARAAGGELSAAGTLVVRAVEPAVVASIHAPNGALVEQGADVVETVRGDAIRFRARALQSDLLRIQDGAKVRVVAATGLDRGGSVTPLDGTLRIAPIADASSRTAEILVELDPAQVANATWDRAGVAASVEITLAGGTNELAIPTAAVVRDGTALVIFRRDPANPDKVIRMDADLGVSDGRWTVIQSGVKAGDEIVVGGNYQLMLATSGSAPKGGHFHSDGTYHEGED